MNIIRFMMDNWHNVVVLVVIVITLYILIKEWVKANGPPFQEMRTKEKIKFASQLMANLAPIALVLVTDAEIEFGAGTGPIKRSWVLNEFYNLIPDAYKHFITVEDMDRLLELTLSYAKELWETEPPIGSLIEPIH